MQNSQRHKMVWESEAATEHRENPSVDGVEDSEEHDVAKRCERVRGRACVNLSLSPKLLGICLVAQQFTTASAEGMYCHALDNIKKKFDLIGFISTFGTSAATKSLSYSALNDNWFYLTGHIGPGSLSVASVLFQATGSPLAKLLSLGENGDAYHIVQLDCQQGLSYIGLKSNTECPVSNAVGAYIVQEHESLWKDVLRQQVGGEEVKGPKFGREMGRDAGRKVKVLVLEVRRKETQVKTRVLLKASKGGLVLLGWLPLLLTVGVLVRASTCNERFVAGLIALGSLGTMVAVMGLRLCPFTYSQANVAGGAPAGDCLVLNNTDIDTFHIIKGEEESIQQLFQRKMQYQVSHGKYALFFAGSILYVYVVASVLYLPNVSASGQILFAIANFIGLVADVLKASKNGKLGLARKAREQFNIVVKDLVVFRNRTAAVAFISKYAADRSMLKTKKLLPCEGLEWQTWWKELETCELDGHGTIEKGHDTSIMVDPPDRELLQKLLQDMRDGLKA